MEPNENSFYPSEGYQEQAAPAETVGRYTAKAFIWMFLGLALTFVVAVVGYATDVVLYAMLVVPYFHIALLIAELAVVLILSARIHKLSVGAARGLFLAYAFLNGVVFSAYFMIFDMMSLTLAFGATALYFGGMAVFGYVTKADLSRLRNILFSGLIFLIVFGVVSLFIPGLEMLDRVVCLLGIAIFMGFTAYDTQKIKAYYAAYAGDAEMLGKASIFSALQLYLDFINIFLYLLRFLGKKK